MSGFIVRYHPLVLKEDLPNLSARDRERIRKAVENKLAVSPERYAKPLGHTLKGYWSLRAGDWRIIFTLEQSEIIVLHIGHRREVYSGKMRETDK